MINCLIDVPLVGEVGGGVEAHDTTLIQSTGAKYDFMIFHDESGIKLYVELNVQLKHRTYLLIN